MVASALRFGIIGALRRGGSLLHALLNVALVVLRLERCLAEIGAQVAADEGLCRAGRAASERRLDRGEPGIELRQLRRVLRRRLEVLVIFVLAVLVLLVLELLDELLVICNLLVLVLVFVLVVLVVLVFV